MPLLASPGASHRGTRLPFRWVSLRGCPPLFLPPPPLPSPLPLSLRRAGLLARAELGKTPPPSRHLAGCCCCCFPEKLARSPLSRMGETRLLRPPLPRAKRAGKGRLPSAILSLAPFPAQPTSQGWFFWGGIRDAARGRTNAPPRTLYCKNKERLLLGNGVNLGCSSLH